MSISEAVLNALRALDRKTGTVFPEKLPPAPGYAWSTLGQALVIPAAADAELSRADQVELVIFDGSMLMFGIAWRLIADGVPGAFSWFPYSWHTDVSHWPISRLADVREIPYGERQLRVVADGTDVVRVAAMPGDWALKVRDRIERTRYANDSRPFRAGGERNLAAVVAQHGIDSIRPADRIVLDFVA